MQRVYTDDRSLDVCVAPGNRDVVMVPRGYHPVATLAGYDNYYLNVMAGPVRRLIPPEEVGIEHRGKGRNQRLVHNILPDNKAADSLLVVEVYTGEGATSSWPSHKHDDKASPDETYLVVLVAGRASVKTRHAAFAGIGKRMSPFERIPPWSVYVPHHDRAEITAETDLELAVCSAPGHGDLPAEYADAGLRRSQEESMSLISKAQQPDSSGRIQHVTPQSAGWEYVGFAAYLLKQGETLTLQSGEKELCDSECRGRHGGR
ncbi:hypothetical protein CRX72_26715 [Pantoea sp. BRM17]|nr:hypothetical protein CRX72_26715 [Pantoea sp. BRM17]